MPSPPQNFANHVRYVPMYHFVCFGLLTAFATRAVIQLIDRPTLDGWFQVFLGVGLLLLAWYARAFALTVQDRVIRLEMGLRMQYVTPQLLAQFGKFTPSQLTALRFASDGELPDLAQQVLDGRLVGSGSIKRAIRQWQADTLRV